jgi:hypothetical protein
MFIEVGNWDTLTDKRVVRHIYKNLIVPGTLFVSRVVMGGDPERKIYILSAVSNQETSIGYYSIDRMMSSKIGKQIRRVMTPKEKIKPIWQQVEERIAARKDSD